MSSLRPPLVIGYTDTCACWDLLEPVLTSIFPLKIFSNLFPDAKHLYFNFIQLDHLTYSPIEVPFFHQPFFRILLIPLPDVKTYKANTRPLIQAWIQTLSYLVGGWAIIIHSSAKVDIVGAKIVDKIKYDISTITHKKDRVYLIDAAAFDHLEKFTELIIACLGVRKKYLEDSYNKLWDTIAQCNRIPVDINTFISTNENLASFYIQTNEYPRALNVFKELAMGKSGKIEIYDFGSLFSDLVQMSDLDQPTIIFSDQLSSKANELIYGDKSYLFFTQYCLGMVLNLCGLMGNDDINCFDNCLDFIVKQRKLLNGIEPIVKTNRWLLNTAIELANYCTSLITKSTKLPSLSTVNANNMFTVNDSVKYNNLLHSKYRILSMIYTHAYSMSKMECNESTISNLCNNAIDYFAKSQCHRFAKALSILSQLDASTRVDKWIDIWHIAFPPFISPNTISEMDFANTPLPTLIFNTFNNSPIPLTFTCPVATKSITKLPVEIAFRTTNSDLLIKYATLIFCNNNLILEEQLILPEGVWILKSIGYNNKIIFPRKIASAIVQYEISSSAPNKLIFNISSPLSLHMYSDHTIEMLDSNYWVCGYKNYIEFASKIDPFELIFPFPVALHNVTDNFAIKNCESRVFSFEPGTYKFIVDFNVTERISSSVVIRSCLKGTCVKSSVTVIPMFEINVRYMSEIFNQLEIISLKPIQVELQLNGTNDSEIKSFPSINPHIPFYLILDMADLGASNDKTDDNNLLIVSHEKKVYKFNIGDLLNGQPLQRSKLNVSVNTGETVLSGVPFAVRVDGSEREAVACEFEESDKFILCGWNRKIFLEDESKFLHFQVHMVPVGHHGPSALPRLRVTKYPSDALMGVVDEHVSVTPPKISSIKVTEL